MSLSGPSQLLPDEQASNANPNNVQYRIGSASVTHAAYPRPTSYAQPQANANQVANLTPQILGGPQYTDQNMAGNKQWQNEWNQAFAAWQANPNANTANTVKLIQQGYSLDQIQNGLQTNAVGTAHTQQQQNQSLVQQMIQHALATDPTIAGFNAQDKAYQTDSTLAGQKLDVSAAQLKSDFADQMKSLGIKKGQAAADARRALESIDAVKREYSTNVAQAHTQFDAGMNSLYSDATARGAVTSGGTRDTRGTLQQQLVEGLTGAAASRDLSLARYNNMLDNARSQAAQYGVDEQQYLHTLDYGLQQLGLDKSINAQQLIEKISGNDAQKAAAAQSVVQQIMGLAQQNPALFQQIAGGMGFGAKPTPAPQPQPNYSVGVGGSGRIS